MGIKQVNNTIAVSVLTLFLTKPLLYGKNKKVYGMGHDARILTANRRRRSKLPRSSEQKKWGKNKRKNVLTSSD